MNTDNLKMKYSGQALMLIKNITDFNESEFYEWFVNQPIGGNMIMNYLSEREVKKNGNIKQSG